MLFHVASVLDVNEYRLDLLDFSKDEKKAYYQGMHGAVVRETVELEPKLDDNKEWLKAMFG